MTSLIERMKEALEKATPGPWFMSGVRAKVAGSDTHSIMATENGKEVVIASVWYDPKTHAGFHDAKHFALASPANLRSVIQALEGAERALDEIARQRTDLRGDFSMGSHQSDIARAALTLIREVTGSSVAGVDVTPSGASAETEGH